MALRSQLLRGDPKLEAAAVSDPAHVVPGTRGPHVAKIQQALIQLDGATIDSDGIYGPATAAAVLAYKRKRNIINRSRQTSADNIVGTMTMASLDTEMLTLEARPALPVFMEPDPPTLPSPGDLAPRRAQLGINTPFLGSGNQQVLGGLLFGQLLGPFNPISNPRVEIALNGFRRVRVTNGAGTIVDTKDSAIAKVVNPDNPTQSPVIISDNKPQIVHVQGVARGRTDLVARTNANPSQVTSQLPVWNGMPGRTITVAFHYLDKSRLGTTRKQGDEVRFIRTMNNIYLLQANIFFKRASAATITADNLSKSLGFERIFLVDPNNFGPDWDKFIAKRNNDAMANVYLVNNFEINVSLLTFGIVFGIADMFKARKTGRRDCMIRDVADSVLLPDPDTGSTVAHEMGHLFGLDHSTTGDDDLMKAGPTGTKIPADQAVKIHEHLDKFPT